jgi:hypothetical protein
MTGQSAEWATQQVNANNGDMLAKICDSGFVKVQAGPSEATTQVIWEDESCRKNK